MSLRKSAYALTLAAGALGFLPAMSFAEDQPIVEVPNSQYNYVGEINASSVNVRSGPAESYYITMKLNKGDKILVVGRKFDWLKIAPPKGSFSYIYKTYVDRQGDSSTGTVNRDEVLVRAGSLLINPPIAQPQMKLDKGATVNIIGETNDAYKIEPPEGAYVYVAQKFVDVIHQATTNESIPAPRALRTTHAGPTTRMASTRPSTGTGTEVEAGTPSAEPGNEPSTPANDAAPQGTDTSLVPAAPLGTHTASPAAPSEGAATPTNPVADFRSLEAQFNQTKDQPLDQRPVDQMLKGYEAVQNSTVLTPANRQMAKYRVAYLKVLQQQQQALKEAKDMQSNISTRQAELDAQRKQIEERLKTTGVQSYAAIGQLETSSLLRDGQPLLRLVDPADGRTLVYIQTNDPKFRGLLDKFVGVRGEVAKDERLSVDIIEPNVVEATDPSRAIAKIAPAKMLKAQ